MWSRKHKACIKCGSSERKHAGQGLCRKCYTVRTERNHGDFARGKRGDAEKFLSKEKLMHLYLTEKLSMTEIGQLAGCSRINVYYKLKKYDIPRRSKKQARDLALDRQKIKVIRNDADGLPYEITYQKIEYDRTFFKSWSKELAYILGLIFTDGNVFIRKDTSNYEIGVFSFGQKDIELVEKMSVLMQTNAKIHRKKAKKYGEVLSGALNYISIGSNELVNDLQKLGVEANKSLTMEYPAIPEEYESHFVRGLFDGDGCVYFADGRIGFSFVCGSLDFIEALERKLRANGLSQRNLAVNNSSKNKSYSFRYSSKADVAKFYKYLYEGSNAAIWYNKKKKLCDDYFLNLNANQLGLFE